MHRFIATLVLVLLAQIALADHHKLPGAVAADPDHYSVEFENDSIRVLRIKYGSGETSSMHTHPENCAIHLTGGNWTMDLPDGSVLEDSPVKGSVECDQGGAHKPTNVGSETAELVLVELKK
jgi:hypothetical protein